MILRFPASHALQNGCMQRGSAQDCHVTRCHANVSKQTTTPHSRDAALHHTTSHHIASHKTHFSQRTADFCWQLLPLSESLSVLFAEARPICKYNIRTRSQHNTQSSLPIASQQTCSLREPSQMKPVDQKRTKCGGCLALYSAPARAWKRWSDLCWRPLGSA